MLELQIGQNLAKDGGQTVNPWTPWEHLASDVEAMVKAMNLALRLNPLSTTATATICSAAAQFTSSNGNEQARTRAKIAYFLVSSFKSS